MVTTDAHGAAVELVALLASAGGLEALSTVLRDLPAGFRAAIVVQQHLADRHSALPAILRRETAHRVDWARDGQSVAPGQVVVGPPGRYLELTGDGRCHLRPLEGSAERRFDVLLASVARAYGPRSVAAILSGSGRDGAAGTAAMKRSGAVVVAESPATAQHPALPMAAARAGADLVLPVFGIGRALADMVAGVRLPAGGPAPTAGCSSTTAGRPGTGGQRGSRRGGPGGLPDLAIGKAINDPAGRAEVARLRADELRRRRDDLAAGFGATAQTVATAKRRAEESRRRAQLAYQAAKGRAAHAAAHWGHGLEGADC